MRIGDFIAHAIPRSEGCFPYRFNPFIYEIHENAELLKEAGE